MTDTSERPSHITLEEPEFPYLIDQQGLNAHSYAVIQHTDLFNKDRELFYLVYPEINFTPIGRDSMSSAEINVKHTFARDPEHSSSSIARFEIASLQISSAFSGTITYTGWLTSARFYPSGYEQEGYEHFNPFVGAVDKGSEENARFPYIPPLVSTTLGEGKTFPIPVEIVLHYDVENAMDSVIQEVRGIFTRRSEDAKRKEEKRIADKAREEERRIQHEAYLLTEEGKEEAADDDFIREMMKVVYKLEVELESEGKTGDDIDSSVVREAAVAYIDSLDHENRGRLESVLGREREGDPSGKAYSRKPGFLLFWGYAMERLGFETEKSDNDKENES